MLLRPFLKCCWHRIIDTLGLAKPAALLSAGAVALLAGCSMVSLGYNRLPDLGVVWLNRQLPLTDEQTAQARTDLAALLAWHRRTQLPATAELLRRWQGMATGDISAEQACHEWGQVRTRLDAIAQQAVPALARLASTITPEQLAELHRTQLKSNTEFRETYSTAVRSGWFTPAHASAGTAGIQTTSPLSAQAGLDKRLNTLRDRYQQLYGRLTDAQTALLRDALQASPFQPERSLADRERHQTALRTALRSIQAIGGTDPAQAQSLVRGWMAGWTTSAPPSDAAYAHQLVRDGCAQWASLHQTTTTEQRTHASHVLQGHEQTLRALMQQ